EAVAAQPVAEDRRGPAVAAHLVEEGGAVGHGEEVLAEVGAHVSISVSIPNPIPIPIPICGAVGGGVPYGSRSSSWALIGIRIGIGIGIGKSRQATISGSSSASGAPGRSRPYFAIFRMRFDRLMPSSRDNLLLLWRVRARPCAIISFSSASTASLSLPASTRLALPPPLKAAPLAGLTASRMRLEMRS